jgi:ankyrin repeat protein
VVKGADVNAPRRAGQTALMWAAAQRHADVVKVLLAKGADVHRRSDVWSQMMAVPPHGVPLYNRMIPQGGDTALLFAARVGDLASAKLLVAAGAKVNDADAWGVSATMLAAHSGSRISSTSCSNVAPIRMPPGRVHRAARRDHATPRGMVTALLAYGADPNAPLKAWTPMRRSSKDYNFARNWSAPPRSGSPPFQRARRDAAALDYGADAQVVHRGNYHAEQPIEPRSHVTNAVLAAAGIGGGTAWVPPGRQEREGLMLESIQIAVELGVDVNAADTDGRTALDAARALKFERVASFLVEHGAGRR